MVIDEVPRGQVLDASELVGLYDAVGWSGYTRDPDVLVRSVANSHLTLTARDDASGALLGLARTISDDATVCYLQDLLVHPDVQRSGIGRALIEQMLERYAHCRFFVLSTDAESTPDGALSHAFYRRMGLVPHHEEGMAALIRPVPRG